MDKLGGVLMEFLEYAFLSIVAVTACAVLLGGVVELFERYVPEDIQDKLVDWFMGRR